MQAQPHNKHGRTDDALERRGGGVIRSCARDRDRFIGGAKIKPNQQRGRHDVVDGWWWLGWVGFGYVVAAAAAVAAILII